MEDFYTILGVPPNAAIAEIKDRYRFLAHAYHPDKFSSDAHKRDADEAFKKINEAFQTLSNPSLRADYDRQRTSGPANEPKSSPPRPAPQPSPPQPAPSSETKRPGAIKYTVAAIFWSIIGGILGASLVGPLTMLAGIIVGLWFGIWVCNREANPSATTPPQPESGERSSPSPVLSVFLIITGGIGLVALMFRLASPSTTAPQKDEWGGIPVDPALPKPAFDPTTAKPVFNASKPFDAVEAPGTATMERPFVNSLGMKFVPVPGTKALFSVWDTRVRDWQAFVQKEGDIGQWGIDGFVENKLNWSVKKELSWRTPGFAQTGEHPVVGVSWEDANRFCAWLSKWEGMTYRLPTDAEWSAAVGPQAHPWGDQFPPPSGAGNYFGGENSQQTAAIDGYNDGFPRTSPVGSFAANRYGLYDMGGNVWQWCKDEYRAAMNSTDLLQIIPALNREKASDGTSFRLVRGGAWSVESEIQSRSSCRFIFHYARRNDYCGFRCVLVVPGR